MPELTSAEFIAQMKTQLGTGRVAPVTVHPDAAARLVDLASIAVNGTKGERIRELERALADAERGYHFKLEQIRGKGYGSARHVEDLERQVREGAEKRRQLEKEQEVTIPTDMLEVGPFLDGLSHLPLITLEAESIEKPLPGMYPATMVTPSARYTISLNPAVIAAILVKLGVKCEVEKPKPTMHYTIRELSTFPPEECSCSIGKNHMVKAPF